MNIDYLPDEMDALASKLGYNGVHPQFADGLVVGWRAACAAMAAKIAETTSRYEDKLSRLIRSNEAMTYMYNSTLARAERAEAAQANGEVEFVSPTEAALDRKAHPQPAPDWRAACVVARREYGWDATSSTGQWWTDGVDWFKEDSDSAVRGFFDWKHQAAAALAACPTPPPDAAEANP
jgi:hypothetical protein